MNFKQQYFNIWGEAWQFHKQFAGMTGTDKEWSELVQTSEEIMKKHEKESHAEFLKSLLMVVVAEIEKKQQDKPDKDSEKIASADNVDIKKRSENSDKEQFSKC